MRHWVTVHCIFIVDGQWGVYSLEMKECPPWTIFFPSSLPPFISPISCPSSIPPPSLSLKLSAICWLSLKSLYEKQKQASHMIFNFFKVWIKNRRSCHKKKINLYFENIHLLDQQRQFWSDLPFLNFSSSTSQISQWKQKRISFSNDKINLILNFCITLVSLSEVISYHNGPGSLKYL